MVLVALTALAAGAAGTGLRKSTHRSVHRATHCGRSVHRRIQGRAGSFHSSHHLRRRSRKSGCARHRAHHRGRTGAGHSRHPRAGARPRTAAAAGGCADVELRPSGEDLDRVRAATLCLVNRERSSRSEQPLRFNGHLEAAAQGHSESMAAGDYFEHLDPAGQTPLDRMRSAGYIYSSRVGFEVGENIAWGTGSLSTPRSIVTSWMASPGHRANILDSHFRDGGIGVVAHAPSSMAHGAAGGIYTQDFGVIVTG